MTVLANDRLGQLFRVPEKTWTVINKRVGEAAAAAEVTGYIEQYIPEFPLLINVCEIWKNHTHDSLLLQSEGITLYARDAAEGFGGLLDTMQTMDISSDKFPDDIAQRAWGLLKALDESTDRVSKSILGIEAQVSDFLAVNEEIDRQIARYKDKLGLSWESFGNIIPEMNLAVGEMSRGWWNLSQQLGELTPDRSLLWLQKPDIETALICWENLELDAAYFRGVAKTQKFYDE
ncbi:hypothetical protein [Dyadobacter sp. LHD-138]|uniref:hypothetical protein n=1 Tax=Dyadobacter sp. LHD-138 TaxID=3071413 RepID=UPI0027DFB035|nr:hypothetical protein [Dyadobacter sp. LHD-138]MDQ6481327.1 hypothetical protein [Dyadobacter sp. LHD-138]